MKILVCTFSFPSFSQGVSDGRFVYSEVAGYAKNGATVTVLTPHFPGAPVDEALEENLSVHRFRYFLPESAQRARQPGKPIYDVTGILALIQIPIMLLLFMFHILRLARHNDIIHAQWTITALLALPAKWMTRTPVVLTARGSDIRLFPRWLNRFIFRQVNAVIDCFGPTAWTRQLKSNFPGNYLRLPHLVLDDSIVSSPPELSGEPHPIVYVGRLHPIKIQDNRLPVFGLIEAAAILKNQDIPVCVFFVGDGEPEFMRQMQKQIDKHQLTDLVHLLGTRTNVMDYMRHAYIGLGGAGFNGVAQEFTICGTPQILMDTKDNEKTPWKDRSNCLVVAPDDAAALAITINWALQHQDPLRQIGLHAQADMASHFAESRAGGALYLDAFTSLTD